MKVVDGVQFRQKKAARGEGKCRCAFVGARKIKSSRLDNETKAIRTTVNRQPTQEELEARA